MMASVSTDRRLVTDFAELRSGMKVIDIACGACGRPECEAMLTTLVEAEPTEGFPDLVAWRYEPDCAPDSISGHFRGISAKQVIQRRIFIVIDGLEPLEDYAAEVEADEILSAIRVHERARLAAAGRVR